MRKAFKIGLWTLTLLVYFTGMGGLLYITQKNDCQLACNNISVKIKGPHHFVSEEGIADFIERKCGNLIGERLANIDLYGIESAIGRLNAVEDSEAWVTKDGTLHIEVEQRDPVIKILDSDKEGYYVDIHGISFPLSKSYEAEVPVIRCKKAKGMDREWLLAAIDFVHKMSRDDHWNSRIVSYSVANNDDFILHSEKEEIIFGDFRDIDRKLRYLDKYFTKIQPREDGYKRVNIKYKGQIICRKKDM